VDETQVIASVLRGYRFRYADEERLQEGIAAALVSAGFSVEREVRLDRYCRIDLLVGRVGIEVKVAGREDEVQRQAGRYLQSDLIDGLVLVSSKVRHVRVAKELNGKPVEVVSLAGHSL
jgi:hypothetical protein